MASSFDNDQVIIVSMAPAFTRALQALVSQCFSDAVASGQDVSLSFTNAGRSFTWEDIRGTYKYGPVFRGSSDYVLAFNGHPAQWKNSEPLSALFELCTSSPFAIGKEGREQMFCTDAFEGIEALCKFFNTPMTPKDFNAIGVKGDLLVAWNKKAA